MTQTIEGTKVDIWHPGHRAKMMSDVVIVAVAAGYTVLASQLGLGDSSRPGPGFFPLLVGVVLILAAGIHLAGLMFKQLRQRGEAGSGRPSLHAGLVLAALTTYVVALPLIGHLLASTIMSVAVLKLLGARHIVVILVIAVLTGFLSDLLFTVVLGVTLPEGPFGLGWAAWI